MDNENDKSKEKDPKPSRETGLGEKLRDQEERTFPVRLSRLQYIIISISVIVLLLSSLYLIEQFCSTHPLSFVTERVELLKEVCRPCVWGTYIALMVVVSAILICCIHRHKFLVQEARLEDPSVVEAIIVEASTIEPRLTNPEKKPDNFEQKVKDLKEESDRLKYDVRSDGWTEYQVLSIQQMLIDFLKVEDLIASARLSLAELEDYAEDSFRRYDWEQCYRWQDKINDAIDKIQEIEGEGTEVSIRRDEAAEGLRAELRMLLEHIASYSLSWAEGSVIVRSMIRCGVFLLLPLLTMGLLPVVHPEGSGNLDILNWGLLGICGAITAVLLSLRKSDIVEVGNTEGKKELFRAVLSTALGLVAGIVGYSMIAGGIFAGTALPKIGASQAELKDIGLSVFWAIAAGYSFERIFDRLRGSTEGVG